VPLPLDILIRCHGKGEGLNIVCAYYAYIFISGDPTPRITKTEKTDHMTSTSLHRPPLGGKEPHHRKKERHCELWTVICFAYMNVSTHHRGSNLSSRKIWNAHSAPFDIQQPPPPKKKKYEVGRWWWWTRPALSRIEYPSHAAAMGMCHNRRRNARHRTHAIGRHAYTARRGVKESAAGEREGEGRRRRRRRAVEDSKVA